jgi:hypothetical protein
MDGDNELDAEGIPDLEGPLPEKAATGDPQEGLSPPADRPASFDYGVTEAEQRVPEPIDVRLRREQPDEVRDDDEPIVVVEPGDEDIGLIDDEKDLVARDAGGAGAVGPEDAAMHIEGT